jgi:hypothetical protein
MTRTDYNLVVAGEGMAAAMAVLGLLKQVNTARMLWIRGTASGECWEFDQSGWEWAQNSGLGADFWQKYAQDCPQTCLQTPQHRHLRDYSHPEHKILAPEAYPALLRSLQKFPNLDILEHTLLLETENTPENRLNLYLQTAEIKRVLTTDYLIRLDTPIPKPDTNTNAYFSKEQPAFLRISLRIKPTKSTPPPPNHQRIIYTKLADYQLVSRVEIANGQEFWEFCSQSVQQQPDALLKSAEIFLKTIFGGEKPDILEQKIHTIETKVRRIWQESQVFYLGAAAYTFSEVLGLKNILFLEELRGLAWRLGLVLSAKSSPALLKGYESESQDRLKRWTHWLEGFQKHTKTGFWSILSGLLPRKWRTKRLETNLLLKQGAITGLGFPKKMQIGGFWQATLRQDMGKDTNFAHLGAEKWLLIGFNQNPIDAVWVEHLDILALLGVACIQLIPSTQTYMPLARLTTQWQDAENSLSLWAKKNKLQFVLLRPDQTFFGVARNLEELDKILDDLVECVEII